jgi:hypothetical protein
MVIQQVHSKGKVARTNDDFDHAFNGGGTEFQFKSNQNSRILCQNRAKVFLLSPNFASLGGRVVLSHCYHGRWAVDV